MKKHQDTNQSRADINNGFVAYSTTITMLIEQLKTSRANKKTLLKQLERLAIASDYAINQLARRPFLLNDLLESEDLFNAYHEKSYQQKLAVVMMQAIDYGALEKALRLFRHREMVRIIWRDVLGYAELIETLRDLSVLADACVLQSLEKLQGWLEQSYGVPFDRSGKRQSLYVIAMGKLGGQELNFSSDIDLIFCYFDQGVATAGDKKTTSQMFFTRLAQQFMLLLSKRTVDGFVFRVDMRLRPYGESGPLATSFVTFQEYLGNHAAAWERYAFAKARVMNAQDSACESLSSKINSFVYNVESQQVIMELKNTKKRLCFSHSGVSIDNVKLGVGGIRYVEFIVQAFQLVNGCNDELLQERNLLRALITLKRKGYLKASVAVKLQNAYVFLRVVENRLQMFSDKQVHHLPESFLGRSRLVAGSSFSDWGVFVEKLHEHQKLVAEQFEYFAEEGLDICTGVTVAVDLFNYKNQRALEVKLNLWRRSLTEAQRRFVLTSEWKAFVKNALHTSLYYPGVKQTIKRILQVLDVLKEMNHLALMMDRDVSFRLIQLCVSCVNHFDQLVKNKGLLVELLTVEEISLPTCLLEMERALAWMLKESEVANFDDLLIALARFKQAYVAKVMVADVLGQLSLMRVSDLLTDIAISLLRRLLDTLWQDMVVEYGKPATKSGERCDLNFIIIAYGKLGGIELGYSSDLDLVFLHDADENKLTNGKDEISGFQFYTRLTQRLVKALSQQGAFDKLYTIDTRLKPMGKSGMLVNSMDQFAEYQKNNAWTWEHQALVRAKVVAGDENLRRRFREVRAEVLSAPRDIDRLKLDIIEMREKMRAEKSTQAGKFNLKRDLGGITDIEFLAQYIVLAWSQHQEALLVFPDNIRIFETCESGALLPRYEVDALCDAYRVMRQARHHLWLLDKKGVVEPSRFLLERQKVMKVWDSLLR